MSTNKKRLPEGGGVDPRLAALDALRYTERRAALGRLSSHIAHELGTPLNVIQARAMMIASGDVTGDAIARNAQIIAEQAAKMTAIIREMLAVTRAQSLARSPVNLLDIAQTACSLVELSSSPRGVNVEIDPASEPTLVQGDSDLLLELVIHLLANGVHATPDGGRVTMTVRAVHRSMADDPKGPAIHLGALSVRDEGAGVPSELVEQIWKPFFTTRPRIPGDGAGLGLCIAQSIAREHGGFIEAESTPQRGSRFTVFVPQGDT